MILLLKLEFLLKIKFNFQSDKSFLKLHFNHKIKFRPWIELQNKHIICNYFVKTYNVNRLEKWTVN